MRRKKAVNNYQESAGTNVDCTTCLERKTCDRAQENSYCGRWHSREADPQGPDPNELWKKGEEVEF